MHRAPRCTHVDAHKVFTYLEENIKDISDGWTRASPVIYSKSRHEQRKKGEENRVSRTGRVATPRYAASRAVRGH